MNKDQFFKDNPGATELLEVDGQFFLANHRGAANECAHRLGKTVVVHTKAGGKKDEAKCEAELAAAQAALEAAAAQSEADAAQAEADDSKEADDSEKQESDAPKEKKGKGAK